MPSLEPNSFLSCLNLNWYQIFNRYNKALCIAYMLHRGKCCWKNITIDTATHDTCVWDVVSVKKKPTLHCQSVDWFLRDFFKSIFFETVEYDKLMYITGRNFEGRTVRNLIFEYFWGLRKKPWNQYQYLILQQ